MPGRATQGRAVHSVPAADKGSPLPSQFPLLISPRPEEYSVPDHSDLWPLKCLPRFRVVSLPVTPYANCYVCAESTARSFPWIPHSFAAVASSLLPLCSHFSQVPAPKSCGGNPHAPSTPSPLMAVNEDFCYQRPVGLPALKCPSLTRLPDPSRTVLPNRALQTRISDNVTPV